ncbi:MAG: hypothetical protein AAGE59_33175 [Cyanobacteria bacterium P01_F01_bin.86]
MGLHIEDGVSIVAWTHHAYQSQYIRTAWIDAIALPTGASLKPSCRYCIEHWSSSALYNVYALQIIERSRSSE